MNALIGLAGFLSRDKPPCPECDEDFTDERPIHRECLEQRYGGKLPDDVEKLIEAFRLE